MGTFKIATYFLPRLEAKLILLVEKGCHILAGLNVVKNFLKAFAGEIANDQEADSVPDTRLDSHARRLEILDDFEQAGITWLWATDTDSHLIYLSEKAAENLNKPLDELIGLPLVALFKNDPDNPDEKSDRPFKYH
ncbi:MAG: hypothetical protein KBT59_05600, partial [Sphingomonadales bacterium]|nr:hypothetical protein [Sphingomonadales bacterium]